MSSQFDYQIRSTPAEAAAWRTLTPSQRRMCQDAQLLPSQFAASKSLREPLAPAGPDKAFEAASAAARENAAAAIAKQVTDRAAHDAWQAQIESELGKGSK